MAAAGRHIRESLSRRPAARGDREGAREHAPEAPEDALRERASGDAVLRPAEARRVPRHVSQRRRRDLGDAAGSRPRAAALARVPDQVSGPDSDGIRRRRRTAAPTNSGARTGGISKPTTSTSTTRRRFARPAGRRATAAGTSRASACPMRCCGRSTTRTRCGTCRRCGRRSNASSRRAAADLDAGRSSSGRIIATYALPTHFRDRRARHRTRRMDGGAEAIAWTTRSGAARTGTARRRRSPSRRPGPRR